MQGTLSAALAPAAAAHADRLAVWRDRRLWIAFGVTWAAFGVLYGATHYAGALWSERPRPAGGALLHGMADSLATALLCLAAWGMAWRFPLGGGRTARNATIAVLTAPAVVVACVVAHMALAAPFIPVPPDGAGRIVALLSARKLVAYVAFLAGGHALLFLARSRAAEVRAARLDAGLSAARLDALKARLDPHFLLNTLNTVSALMRRDVDAADRVLVRLGELLSVSLARSGQDHVTVGEELEFVEAYLDIQKARYGPRLRASIVLQPGIGRALVPALLVQPLVENAIRHGVDAAADGADVRLEVRRDGPCLEVRVWNSGPAPEPGAVRGRGIGLGVTRARLEQTYGADHRMELRAAPEGGAEVVVRVPLRTAPRRGEAAA
jgi:LytS/YehU family sensor histidine kinase